MPSPRRGGSSPSTSLDTGVRRETRRGVPPKATVPNIVAALDGLAVDRAILVGHDASGPDAVIWVTWSPTHNE